MQCFAMCFCKKRRLNCFLFSQFSELPMYFLFAMIDVLPAGLKSLGINKYRFKTARRPLKISTASSPYKPDTQNVCRPKYFSCQWLSTDIRPQARIYSRNYVYRPEPIFLYRQCLLFSIAFLVLFPRKH